MVNQEFIKKYIVPNTKLSYVDIVLKIHDIEVKELFYPWYIKQKIADLQQYINTPEFNDSKYSSYFSLCNPIDLLIVITKQYNSEIDKKNITEQLVKEPPTGKDDLSPKSNIDKVINTINKINTDISSDDAEYDQNIIQDDDDDEEKTLEKVLDNDCMFVVNENLKFRIVSSFLPHNFELFRIKYQSYFSTVSRFHLPIVRAYYDGNKTYVLPSCISACMTMMNLDYKYFAGSKDPIEIINKYRMRGYGTYLNGKEKIKMIEYSNIVEKWKKLYNVDIKNNNSVNAFFGPINIDAKIFKPSHTLELDRIVSYSGSFFKDNNKITLATIDKTYGELYNGKFDTIGDGIQHLIYKTTCINKLGYITPLRKWLIEACYEQPVKSLLVNVPDGLNNETGAEVD